MDVSELIKPLTKWEKKRISSKEYKRIKRQLDPGIFGTLAQKRNKNKKKLKNKRSLPNRRELVF